MFNEDQNQSEQSFLTAKPMASTTLNSISHNTFLILTNKKRLLTAPGGMLIAGISLINLWQDSGTATQDCAVCSHIQETKPKIQAPWPVVHCLTATLET